MHMSKRALALAATSVVAGVVGAGLAAVPANAAVIGDVTFSASSGSINDGPFLQWARSSGPCPTGFGQGASLDVVIDVDGNGSIDLVTERFSLGPTLNEGGYDTAEFVQVDGVTPTARTLETRLQGRKGEFEIRISCLSMQFQASPDYYATSIIVEGDTWRLNEDVDPDPEPQEGEQNITTTVEQGEGQLTMTIGDDAQVTLPAPQLDGDRLSSEGDLDPVTVSDTRAGAPGWDTTAQVSEFSASETSSFEGKYLGWTPEVVSSTATGVVAGATVAPGFSEGTGLSEPRQLAGAPAGSGAGSSELGAGLSLEIPTDTAAGTYTATLTLTTI